MRKRVRSNAKIYLYLTIDIYDVTYLVVKGLHNTSHACIAGYIYIYYVDRGEAGPILSQS